jgi:T5SS/PEP-CTERM-associated repeat protein
MFFCSRASAEDNQLLIIDSTSTNFPGYPFVIGDTGTNNYLIITNGGSATSAGVWVGNNTTANDNGMLVTGGNSSYQGPLTIGTYGSRNKLIISNGGSVHNNSGQVGAYAASSCNTAVVDGSNSVWTIDAMLDVGWGASSNQLFVVNGGKVNANSSVGSSSMSHDNLVQVIGHGSVWNGGVTVGFYGVNNRLIISEGGQLTNGNIILGAATQSASNVVCIAGANSQIDVDFFTIGDSGSSNMMIIRDGGNAIARNGKIGTRYVGGRDAISNALLISGSNSICTIRNDMYVGYLTSGSSLGVLDGGRLTSGNLYITGGSNNVVQISNGVVVVSNLFSVATGPLEIDDGECWIRQLTCDRAGGGQILLNSGLLAVTQASTISYGTNTFTIGTTSGGVGTLKLLSGSHSLLADNGVLLGLNAGSRGELFIAGPNALVRGPLYVGDNGLTHGSGFASISCGAVLEANMIVCGSNDLDSIVNDAGIFQFTIPNPSVSSLRPNSCLLTNGTISFRNVTNANPEYLVSSPSSITFRGSNAFRLFNSASVLLDTYEFGTSSNNRYARLVLTNGVTLWNCTHLIINAGGELICDGTVPTIGFAGGTLVVTNGGKVKNSVGATDFNRSMSNFSLTITGTGTLWTNSADFAVGRQGASNHCLVNGGATLQDQIGYMGYDITSSNNDVTVSGNDSLWVNASSLIIGQSGSRNVLYIENGGEVRSAQMTIGANTSSVSNQVQIDNGRLFVTNTLANAEVAVRRGDLILQGGTVVVDQLTATTGTSGRIAFHSGTISAKGVAVNNGAPFVVGDGIQPAILLIGGGNFSFANGLVISSNAVLCGYGNILNNVTNFGTIIADKPGAKLSFKAYLDNHGAITTTNGGAFFQLTGISRTNVSVQITTEGIRGLTFALEYKDKLLDADWATLLSSIPITNSPMIMIDSNAVSPKRIYRIRAQ